jgi:hypothetical protein
LGYLLETDAGVLRCALLEPLLLYQVAGRNTHITGKHKLGSH